MWRVQQNGTKKCLAVREKESRDTKTTGTNNAIMFELEFKGMGAFNGQTETYLRRGILGYQ